MRTFLFTPPPPVETHVLRSIRSNSRKDSSDKNRKGSPTAEGWTTSVAERLRATGANAGSASLSSRSKNVRVKDRPGVSGDDSFRSGEADGHRTGQDVAEAAEAMAAMAGMAGMGAMSSPPTGGNGKGYGHGRSSVSGKGTGKGKGSVSRERQQGFAAVSAGGDHGNNSQPGTATSNSSNRRQEDAAEVGGKAGGREASNSKRGAGTSNGRPESVPVTAAVSSEPGTRAKPKGADRVSGGGKQVGVKSASSSTGHAGEGEVAGGRNDSGDAPGKAVEVKRKAGNAGRRPKKKGKVTKFFPDLQTHCSCTSF